MGEMTRDGGKDRFRGPRAHGTKFFSVGDRCSVRNEFLTLTIVSRERGLALSLSY